MSHVMAVLFEETKINRVQGCTDAWEMGGA